MANVHVNAVTQNWPKMENGLAEMCTIDFQVDGKYVRMGYHTEDLPDSAAVEAKLTVDSDVIKSAEKQHDSTFPFPVGGTDRSDLVPADFVV